MRFPKHARYGWVIMSVHKFLIENHITKFPIDPFEIIKKCKWGLISYSELSRLHGVTIDEVITTFQSEDGYTIYDGQGYTMHITIPSITLEEFVSL